MPSRVRAAGAKIWSPDFRDLTPEVLAAARAEKLRIVAWTVNEPADIARMIEAGIDGIISDYPDRVIEITKRKTRKP
jgi:glycerophosphoryl diester phosphodiesterase